VLVDAHAHLDLYEEELEEAVAQIESRRILTISTSMNARSYLRNVEIARTCRYILPVFGVHPWNAAGYAGSLDELRPHIDESPMLGEVGLDYYFVKHAHRYPDQRRVFEAFLRVAADCGKAVNLHTKGAEEDVLALLDRYGIDRAIIHWYSGPMDILDEMIARGYYFTVGVEAMYSDAIKEIVRRIPSDRLLTETDNPGAVKWLKGEVGMPEVIEDVIECVAPLKGMTREEAMDAVGCNLRRLLVDDPHVPDAFRSFL
jgi:TatD DNase family protein